MVMNERSIEYSFVFKCITTVSPKSILDVGTGLTALPAVMSACGVRVAAIDNNQKQINQNKFCKQMIKKADILDPQISTIIKDRFDMITCISVLEHIGAYHIAIKNMTKLLNNRGFILFSFPFNQNEYHKSAYKIPGAGYGTGSKTLCQIFNSNIINDMCKGFQLKIYLQEYWKVFSGKYWTFGKRLSYPFPTNKNSSHQLTCLLLRKL